MNSTTLRGIFPGPKPVHRKNFVKENMRQIRQIQQLAASIREGSTGGASGKTLTAHALAHRTSARLHRTVSSKDRRSSTMIVRRRSAIDSFTGSGDYYRAGVRRNSAKGRHQQRPVKMPTSLTVNKYGGATNRVLVDVGVQTERIGSPEEKSRGGSAGTNLGITNTSRTNEERRCTNAQDRGDAVQKLSDDFDKIAMEDKRNYIRENIQNVRQKLKKNDFILDPNQPPPNYHKGEVPKYLRVRKDEMQKTDGTFKNPQPVIQNPPQIGQNGLILLPEDERKEYLRVARENYAGLIRELNSMPVSNDTLKKMRRKMEIEEELKKIDDVIKVFQKPKVFVKSDF